MTRPYQRRRLARREEIVPVVVTVCKNCHLLIEEEVWGWIHVSTAERECWGYPFYGTVNAIPDKF